MSDPADAPDAGDPTSAAADTAEESESPAHDGRARLGRVVRRTGRWGLCVLVALTGAVIGVLLLGRTSAPLGPFDARFSVSPTGGGVALDIPPLGALDV